MLNTCVSIRNFLTWQKMVICVCVTGVVVLFSLSVGATEPSIPWQCTSYTYTEPTQEECIQAYSNDQGRRIAKLESQLKRQEVLINELKDLINRQARQQNHNIPAYPRSYDFAPPPAFGGGQFGFGSLLGLGIGLLPPVAIVID